jgi:L-arabinose isomerase
METYLPDNLRQILMPRRAAASARVGVFGIGLAAYWPQFAGLKERLESYQQHVEATLGGFGADVVSAGLVDSAPSATEAGTRFAASDLDLIVCYIGTYATSSQVLPVVQRAKVPVLVLNLQPVAALDYGNTDTGEWLANCSTCCAPEISNAFARARVDFHIVSGMLFGDAQAWDEVRQWCAAAQVVRALRSSRIGFLGHTYPGMLDMYSDFTMVTARTGAHIEVLEMCDLNACVEEVTESEVEEKTRQAEAVFTIEDADPRSLEWAARVAAGLDRLVERFDLHALTYYYRGLAGNYYEQLGAGLILGNSLLTARGIPASGEGDLKTCVAMILMDRLGAGGSYTEFYAMDFRDNFVLMGHDGPGHLAISARRPTLRGLGLYHGKRGSGVSVEFAVRTGPVTLLGVTQTASGELKLLVAEGESLPGPTLKIGNTNSRLQFPLGPREFVNQWCRQGPTHHCALGVGRQAQILQKCAELMGWTIVQVC